MKQLIKPWYGGKASAGACLYMAQLVVGASGGPYSATVAANATKHRHHDRSFPHGSIAAVWFSHWGTYTDYRNNERRYEDWGHVVIWDPAAFDRAGGFFSSRRTETGAGEWFRTIADVEASFNATYRFWSEDLNGVRICVPAATNRPQTNLAAKPAAPIKGEPMPTRKSTKQYKPPRTGKGAVVLKPNTWTGLHVNDKGWLAFLENQSKEIFGTLYANVHVDGEAEIRFRYYETDTKTGKSTITGSSASQRIDTVGTFVWPFSLSKRAGNVVRKVAVEARPVGSGELRQVAVATYADYWEK